MQKIKGLIFFFSLVTWNNFTCDAQFTIVKGTLNCLGYSDVRVLRYSAIEPENYYENYPAKNGKFEFKIPLGEATVSRIFNNYFLVTPNDTLQLDIQGEHIPVISTSDEFNNKFLAIQKRYDSLQGSFWHKDQYSPAVVGVPQQRYCWSCDQQ